VLHAPLNGPLGFLHQMSNCHIFKEDPA